MRRFATVAALSIGLGAGGYGIASAAGGTASTTTAPPAATAPPTSGATGAGPQGATHHGWGGQRSDETPLTGDALAKVTAAAKGKVPDGTIVRVETDADGNAKYEAHMTKADGSLVTVYVDASFNAVSVQTR
jgi:hypothetical protein